MDDAQSGMLELVSLTRNYWIAFAVVWGVAKLWPMLRGAAREQIWPLRWWKQELINSAHVWILAHLPGHALTGQPSIAIRATLNLHPQGTAPKTPLPHILQMARQEVCRLREACDRLGIALPRHGRVSRALLLRTAQHNRRASWIVFGMFGSLIWAPRVARIVWAAGSDMVQRARETGFDVGLFTDVASKTAARSNTEITDLLSNFVASIFFIWFGAIVLFFLLGWPFVIMLAALSGRNIAGIRIRSAVARRRYGLVKSIARAVEACADVHTAKALDRPDALRRLSERLARVEQHILQAHQTSAVLRRRSPIRKTSRSHGKDVAKRIRAAEADFLSGEAGSGTEPRLAELLIIIADRYVIGRIDELLGPDMISHPKVDMVGPVRDYELLRITLFAALWAAAAVGIGLLGLSDGAETAAIGAAALITAALVYKQRWLSVLERLPINLN